MTFVEKMDTLFKRFAFHLGKFQRHSSYGFCEEKISGRETLDRVHYMLLCNVGFSSTSLDINEGSCLRVGLEVNLGHINNVFLFVSFFLLWNHPYLNNIDFLLEISDLRI